jgi:Zn-dependent protease with chaperone function
MPSSSIAGRALLGLSLLAGFYVLAGAVVVAVIGAGVLLVSSTGRLPPPLAFGGLLVVLAVVRAVFHVERADPDADGGVEVGPAEEPTLWAMVRTTAEALGTRAPDAIRLVHDVNASVEERGGLLGLLPGRRTLRVGVALLQTLDAEELRAVLAHEMGHYAGGDTKLGAVSYRGSESLRRTVVNLGQQTLLGRLFAAYAALYQRVTLAVRRRQELAADRAAVRLTGPDAHAGALRKVAASAAAYGFYLDRYVAPLWEQGTTPADLFDGYRRLLAEPGRQEEMAQVLAAELAAAADPYDSHPSLAERLAAVHGPVPAPEAAPERIVRGKRGPVGWSTPAVGSAPAPPSSAADHRPARATAAATTVPAPPARSVLRDAALAERRVALALARRATRGAEVREVAWEEAGVLMGAGAEQTAFDLAAFVGRLDGADGPVAIDRVLERCRPGAEPGLAEALTGDLSHLPADEQASVRTDVLVGELAACLGGALTAQGAASWRVRWSDALELVAAEGPLPLHALVRAAVEAGDVDGLRARLVAVGLDPSWVPVRPEAPTTAAPQVVGMLSDVGFGRRRHDLVLLADRFALLRVRLTALDAVTVALSSALGGSVRGDGPAARRWERVQRSSVEELLADAPGNLARAWDDVVDAQLRKRMGGWVLTLTCAGGEVVRCKSLATAAPHDDAVASLEGLLGARLRTGARAKVLAVA